MGTKLMQSTERRAGFEENWNFKHQQLSVYRTTIDSNYRYFIIRLDRYILRSIHLFTSIYSNLIYCNEGPYRSRRSLDRPPALAWRPDNSAAARPRREFWTSILMFGLCTPLGLREIRESGRLLTAVLGM